MRAFRPVLLLLLIACPAAAQVDEDSLPAVRQLACDSVCAQSTPAVSVDPPQLPVYPGRYAREAVEAFVSLRYTVGTDGAVKDIVILHLVGPKEFSDSAINAIKDRKFAPATLNGRPVEQSRSIDYTFDLRIPGTESKVMFARAEVVATYRDAAALIKERKNDEAMALLTKTAAEPGLNFYERSMLAGLIAPVAISKGDFLTARSAVELPTTAGAKAVPSDVLKNLLRFRVIADLGTGDADDAVFFLERLKQTPGFDPADPLVKLVEDARIKTDAAPQVTILRKVPQINDGVGDYFSLARRNFSFTVTSGSLDKFSMNCRQQTIESKISEKAEWHVPKDWDRCSLFVEGTPGTIYKVNEFTD